MKFGSFVLKNLKYHLK